MKEERSNQQFSVEFPDIPFAQHARLSTGRIAAIDLRIGLNMLGEQGRKLLAEYIATKRQERETPDDH